MVTYEHICTDEDCKYEWEDEYSIHDNPPKVCPKCGKETAKRLISGGGGNGNVKLYGHELKNKLKEDALDMKKRILTDEKYAANFYGEGKFEEVKKHNEKTTKENEYIKRQFRRVK